MTDLPDTTAMRGKEPPRHGLSMVPAATSALNPAAIAFAALRVLVVDNDRQIAMSLLPDIRGWGHNACWASSPGRGLIKAVRFQPNVVLVDIALTSMLGYALAQEMRLDCRLRGCLLVAMRCHADNRRDGRYRQADFDQFLAKPIDKVGLKQLLMREFERLHH